MFETNKKKHLENSSEPQICLYRSMYCNKEIKLNALDLDRHMAMMHNWANQWYATKYWQMNADYESFSAYYRDKLKSKNEWVIIICLENIPVAQVEIYQVCKDRIAAFADADIDGYGFHLLMAPYRDLVKEFGNVIKGLSCEIIRCVLEYLFNNCNASAVYAEPDIENIPACKLAEKAGFTFLKNIELPEKTACLYRYRRNDFILKYPIPKRINYMNLLADKGR